MLPGWAAFAQSRGLDFSSRWDDQGNAVIEVSEHDGNIYTVIFDFYNVENLSVGEFDHRQVSGRGPLFTLKKIDVNKTATFRYTCKYFSGSVNPRRVDSAFVYRLPYALSESREPHELSNVNDRLFGKDDNTRNFKAFQFYMSRGDTIYAVRKGEVINVVDNFDPLVGVGEVSMNTDSNEVSVEHPDGTIARYNVLERGSIMVKPGDIVFPGTSIALAGTLDGERYQTRFDVYYQTDNLSKIRSLSEYTRIYHYINPIFATTTGETTIERGKLYKPVCTEEMIIREMTKRELRSRNKGGN